jgi:hypothetical protein
LFFKIKRGLSFTILFTILFSFLTGCSSPTPQVVEITRIVPQTVVVTVIFEKIVTATPVPATPTPISTATPEATATPVFAQFTSGQVVEAFKSAGLEAENPRPMTKDDYGLAPYVALEGTRFLIPSLCSDCGGRIMSFATEQDLNKTRDYYVTLGQKSAAFYSWTFVKGNILVQINGDLPEAKARQYEAALENLK